VPVKRATLPRICSLLSSPVRARRLRTEKLPRVESPPHRVIRKIRPVGFGTRHYIPNPREGRVDHRRQTAAWEQPAHGRPSCGPVLSISTNPVANSSACCKGRAINVAVRRCTFATRSRGCSSARSDIPPQARPSFATLSPCVTTSPETIT
jgi:hypothetical protein